MPDDDDLADVVRLERQLLDPGVRGLRDHVTQLLHPDFVEYGSSGRVWDRAAMIDALYENPEIAGEGADFAPVRLSDDVVLLTYRVLGIAPSLRSSVWVRHDGRWQMRFHQGTRELPRGR